MRKKWDRSLGQKDPLEKEMVAHSSILAWRTPRTEELGGLQSMGCKEWDTAERPDNKSQQRISGHRMLVRSMNF